MDIEVDANEVIMTLSQKYADLVRENAILQAQVNVLSRAVSRTQAAVDPDERVGTE